MWAMYQNLDATADNVAVMANFRKQDAEFCRRLLLAIQRGHERCPTRVDTTPGTVRPILGYSLR